jgi:hypothetical protein
VIAGAFAPTHGESDEPQDEKHGRRYPQQMDCEPGSKEDQNQQQCKYKYHESTSLF